MFTISTSAFSNFATLACFPSALTPRSFLNKKKLISNSVKTLGRVCPCNPRTFNDKRILVITLFMN